MFLSEHKMSYEEFLEKNNLIISEDTTEDDLMRMYEEYLKSY